MKRRTKRDLTIFFGALIIIIAVAAMNTQVGRLGMREDFEKQLLALESRQLEKGDLILEWKYMRKTKGTLRKGGRFAEEVLAHDGDVINLIGYMVPQAEFRNVTEFLLLPIPLECYFCSMPPPRDVMLIQLEKGETTHIYEDPVILSGRLNVNQGPDQKFFYKMDHVMLEGLDGIELKRKRLELQHMLGGEKHPDADADDGMLEPSGSRRVSDPSETD